MAKILSYLRRAVDDYAMIAPGDRVAVGVSGGKDSLAALCALAELQRFYPHPFELEAITLDMGGEAMDFSGIAALCTRIGVPYSVHATQIREIVFDIRKEPNPCALCANLRRGALNRIAKAQGCNKVVLGHHFDDAVETFMLSLFFEGRVSCFTPVTHLTRMDITALRPLIYAPERDIIGYVRQNALPVVHNPCPANGNTKRQYIKELLGQLGHENRGLKGRLFTALKNSVEGWQPVRTSRNQQTYQPSEERDD